MDGILFSTFGLIFIGFVMYGGFRELINRFFENSSICVIVGKILFVLYSLYIFLDFKNSLNDWRFFEKIDYYDVTEVRYNDEIISHTDIKREFIQQLKLGNYRIINKEIINQDTLTVNVGNRLYTFKLWTKINNEMMIHLYGPHGFIKTYRNDKLVETVRWLKDSKEN